MGLGLHKTQMLRSTQRQEPLAFSGAGTSCSRCGCKLSELYILCSYHLRLVQVLWKLKSINPKEEISVLMMDKLTLQSWKILNPMIRLTNFQLWREWQEDKNCTFVTSYKTEVFLPSCDGQRPQFSYICISITFFPLSKAIHLNYGFIICQVCSLFNEITWQLINWKRKSTPWGLLCSKGSVFLKIKFPTWKTICF